MRTVSPIQYAARGHWETDILLKHEFLKKAQLTRFYIDELVGLASTVLEQLESLTPNPNASEL